MEIIVTELPSISRTCYLEYKVRYVQKETQNTKKLQKGSKQTKKKGKNDTVQYLFSFTDPHSGIYPWSKHRKFSSYFSAEIAKLESIKLV
jgi:hypothetical protein